MHNSEGNNHETKNYKLLPFLVSCSFSKENTGWVIYIADRFSAAGEKAFQLEVQKEGGMGMQRGNCPHFIPRLWPAVLRSTPQYKPDTPNHDTLLFWPSCKSITSLRFKSGTCRLHVLNIYFSCLEPEMFGWLGRGGVKSMMNVFWPEESGWSVSVSAAITADSGVTGQ